MKRTVKKLLIATSIAAGMGGIFTAPALAGSLTNASIGGSAAEDYLIYGSDATNTFRIDKTPENLQSVLSGNAGNPTGNVELAASSEVPDVFKFAKNTTLTGEIGGEKITLSSLTENDWKTDVGGMSFGQRWFSEALAANGYGDLNPFLALAGFQQFKNLGGLQRFSDPNISYVNQDDISGDISIGLAGHFDATPLIMAALPGLELKEDAPPIQVSEIVKVTYGGVTEFLYSFEATRSGLTERDDKQFNSHDGNYEVTFKPNMNFARTATVPEPSVMLGLLSVGGIFASKRRKKKA